MEDSLNRISVVVATKDRPHDLSYFLESVAAAGDIYDELLVIDSSTNNLILETNKLNTLKVGGRHIIFNEKGLSKARNHGIEQSQADIIAFADDDFVVKKGWLENLIERFKDSNVFCVTGRMLSFRQDASSNLYERSMSFDRGDKPRFFSKKDLQLKGLFPVVAKMGQKRLGDQTPVPYAVGFGFCAFRKSIFCRVGFFDVNLGRGTKAIGADDVDMFYRILKRGFNIVYEPNAVVLHNHRLGQMRILQDSYNSGKSVFSFASKYFAQDLYVRCISFGYFSLLVFSSLRAAFSFDSELKTAINMELKGFFANWL